MEAPFFYCIFLARKEGGKTSFFYFLFFVVLAIYTSLSQTFFPSLCLFLLLHTFSSWFIPMSKMNKEQKRN